MQNLKGKVAVITGGGSGLGRELALRCAARGMKLVLGDVDEAGMQETLNQVKALDASIESATMRLDVSKLDQVEAFAALAKSRFGGAHLLFNNAGVSVGGPVWMNTQADWEWVVGVNMYGVAWGLKAFTPMMIEQGEGHIVNVASAAGWVNGPSMAVYNATKHSVVAMSETLALDLRDVGAKVGVTVLCPAFFPTGIHDSARNRPADMADTLERSAIAEERAAAIKAAVEKGRIKATDVAEMTLKAVEDDQFYVFPHRKIKELIKLRAAAADAETTVFDSMNP
ncbi:SDR family NAD(P)-dependent oxidoreductase [Halopseudomonas laoshanensis]|uniref:SDR family NAD(P)-dependent oxidoreductase n=1 Tax=Halopseudomonas laoshanensis TaxID=2268758 RepID=A0A7V7GVX4_9GAMM|nr:SDR family NAD(P)-dependent oxidoreductase [Halopseudomonas laoshanensis]KAA0694731.1 SDR family NAD(P)-dependent oxidoreductase [Halopseudomonas laoshanensis]